VTTENSDWATSCPEYKVTAVEVAPANHKSQWQETYEATTPDLRRILERGVVEPAE
jgi:formate dehydrogenase major subunit